MLRLLNLIGRANSHIFYYRYRKRLGNGGPTLLQACGQWLRRVAFELRHNYKIGGK